MGRPCESIGRPKWISVGHLHANGELAFSAFKDVALQFLGNVFEFFLARKNEGKTGKEREHLTIAAATSGDTGSAAIYGLRSKADISLFILYPTGKISPIQEAQMTTVKDPNVHCLSVDGTFDDCQVRQAPTLDYDIC